MKNPKVPSSIDYEDICNGCGLCCILRFEQPTFFGFADAHKGEDCPNLVRLPNTLTVCSIHGSHTGSIIKRLDGKRAFRCVDIMQVPTLFEECPYNERKVGK